MGVLVWVVATMAVAGRLPAPEAGAVFLLFSCVWAVVWLVYVLQVPHYAVVGVLAIAVLQDVILGLFGGGALTRTGALFSVVLTTAMPLALAAWFAVINPRLLKSRGLSGLHLAALAYCVIVVLRTVTSGQSPGAILPAFRNAVAFLGLFYFGLLLPKLTFERQRRVSWGLAWLTFLVVLFGFMERFLLGDAFWIDVLHLDVIAAHKNLVLTAVVPEPLPADFYSPIGGQYYRRMASLFATPISMGYFVAFALLYALPFANPLSRRSWKVMMPVAVLILGATLLLTLVKGAYGIAGLGVMAMGAGLVGRRLKWTFSTIVGIWITLALPAVVAGIFLFPRSTAMLHLYGLVFTVQGLGGIDMLLGRGLGTGGTISARLGADVAVSEATGAESGIGTLLYQTGVVGVGLYLAFSLLLLRRLYLIFVDERAPRNLRLPALGVLAALFGLLGAVFLQENALAPIPIAPYYIFAGLLVNLHCGWIRGRDAGNGQATRASSA